MLQRTELVEHAPQGPNIRLEVVGFLLANLWREVVRCAYFCRGKSILAGEYFGDAHIADAYLMVLREEDVQRLQIAVHDVLGVQVVDSHAYLNENTPHHIFRKQAGVAPLEVGAEIPALAVLHYDVNALRFVNE